MSEQYDPIAGLYTNAQKEFFQGKLDPARGFIYTHLPRQNDVQILDLGCGAGTDVESLLNLGYQNVKGIDSSAEQIALAQSQSSRHECFNVGSFEATGMPDKSVDLIVCRYSLFHVRNLDAAYTEMARILRPGGKLIIADSNPKADALEDREDTPDGPRISYALYDGKVKVHKPLHTQEEFLSETFLKFFKVDETAEFQSPDRISRSSAIPVGMAITAIRKGE